MVAERSDKPREVALAGQRANLDPTLRIQRRMWLLVLAVAPLPLALAWSWHVADEMGTGLAEYLLGWAGLAASDPPPVRLSPDLDGGAVTTDPAPLAPSALGLAAGAPADQAASLLRDTQRRRFPRGTARGTSGPVPKRGVRVSAATVLRLANSGARPSGIPVPAEGPRPAGLMLTGVSALGVGILDGDVLTHAGGRPALSEADVVSLVIAARGRQVSAIGGRFWRNGEPWNLVVEQPYVREDGRPVGRSVKAFKQAADDTAYSVRPVAVTRRRRERGSSLNGQDWADDSDINSPPKR